MTTISHHFSLPTFEPLPKSDVKVFEDALVEIQQKKYSRDAQRILFFALAHDLSDTTKRYYDPAQTFYEETARRTFRHPKWHTDSLEDEAFHLFATSTPATYASFDLEADLEKFKAKDEVIEFYENRDSNFRNPEFMPAEVVRVLGYVLCEQWLEVAGGYEKHRPTSEFLDACGVAVSSLVMVQAKPFEVAGGRSREVVHTPSLRKRRAPKARLLSRSNAEVQPHAIAA